jgi:hypothetical protein
MVEKTPAHWYSYRFDENGLQKWLFNKGCGACIVPALLQLAFPD